MDRALCLLLLLLCLMEGAALSRDARPVLVGSRSAPPVPAAAAAGLEPSFAAQLTPDDVARGVRALQMGEGPGLTAAQAGEMVPAVAAGLAARQKVEELRAARRRAQDRWQASWAQIAAESGRRPVSAGQPGMQPGMQPGQARPGQARPGQAQPGQPRPAQPEQGGGAR